jgi:Spy/CpxP family protein refolding chaperone
MKMTGKIALGILAGLGVAASAAVLAHGHGPMMGHGPDGFGPKEHCRAGGPEAHLDTLKTELKLTAKQESAWQAFEKTVREQLTSHGPAPAGTTAGTDPMQSRIAFMEQRLAGMKTVAKARADLYKVLTPEQKAVLDQHGPHGRHG